MSFLHEEWAEQDEKATREALDARLYGDNRRKMATTQEEGGEYNPADHIEMSELAEYSTASELQAKVQKALRAGNWLRVECLGKLDHFEALDGDLCLRPLYKPGEGKNRGTHRVLAVWDSVGGANVTHVTLNHEEWSRSLRCRLQASGNVRNLEPWG